MKVAQEHAVAFFQHLEMLCHDTLQKLLKLEPSKGFFNNKTYLLWMDTVEKAKANYALVHTNRVFMEYSRVHAPSTVVDVDSGYKELFLQWFVNHQLHQNAC
jgi:hypothetical protein